MQTKSFLVALAMAAAAAAPALASAQTITLSPTGGGSYAGSFVMSADGFILDDFSFSPASFTGLLSVTLSSVSGPVTFFTAALFPNTASEIDFGNPTNTSGGNFSFSSNITSAMPLTLSVFGAAMDANSNFVPGSYQVAVTETVAAVPEPETYALMAMGLGAMALLSRRRGAAARVPARRVG